MAQKVLNNGESNLIIRTKINDNFAELYDLDKPELTKLSEFENDAGFITSDELPPNRNFIDNPIDLENEVTGILPINFVNTSSLFDGDYNNLSNKPVIKNGEDGFSPTITENINNNNDIYKLDIITKEATITTPNLMGPMVQVALLVV